MAVTPVPLNRNMTKKMTKECIAHLQRLMPTSPNAEQLASWIFLKGIIDAEHDLPVTSCVIPLEEITDEDADETLKAIQMTLNPNNVLCVKITQGDGWESETKISKNDVIMLYRLCATYLSVKASELF